MNPSICIFLATQRRCCIICASLQRTLSDVEQSTVLIHAGLRWRCYLVAVHGFDVRKRKGYIKALLIAGRICLTVSLQKKLTFIV